MGFSVYLSLLLLFVIHCQADDCAQYKKCRDYWKSLGRDSLPKYDEDSYPDVGEWMCLNTVNCPTERYKFCSAHKDDGHELVHETCDDWAHRGYEDY